ncbi:MAG: hypothetical protein ABW170_00685 [Candidatus Thiodiazotropha sp. L084R]
MTGTSIKDEIYESSDLMASFEYDITLAAAYLLGKQVSDMASKSALTLIEQIRQGVLGQRNFDRLIEDMCVHPEYEFERMRKLFSAFLDGVFRDQP